MAKFVLPYRTTVTSSPTLEEVPEGWTTDPSRTSYLAGGEWPKIAKRGGLENPVPIMCTTPESGEHYGLISAGGRYYFTNNLAWTILEILKPTTLDGILQKIFDEKESSIKMKVLEEEWTEEDLEEEEKAEIALMEQMKADSGYIDWEAMKSDQVEEELKNRLFLAIQAYEL
ncbi:hypothetical protein CNMCM5793_009672 [Aspergillus hiratsukae]|uniref:Uncharacterized protein n=1 Tax=Aspergillus hiratsukae TaxID=1194566 RepID=A0A8H6P130_9EURO|nr:hypothetical protein CNMCM5793_009672 [Aspergillus hiratsukae]KAF7156182.1 hypothetical protein CNMCM6106_009247 [Aspergillus hiratsukae]